MTNVFLYWLVRTLPNSNCLLSSYLIRNVRIYFSPYTFPCPKTSSWRMKVWSNPINLVKSYTPPPLSYFTPVSNVSLSEYTEPNVENCSENLQKHHSPKRKEVRTFNNRLIIRITNKTSTIEKQLFDCIWRYWILYIRSERREQNLYYVHFVNSVMDRPCTGQE